MSPSAPSFTRIKLAGPSPSELKMWLDEGWRSYQATGTFGGERSMLVDDSPTSVQIVAAGGVHGGRYVITFCYLRDSSKGQPVGVGYCAAVLIDGMWMWFQEGLLPTSVIDRESREGRAAGRLLVRIDEAIEKGASMFKQVR